MTATAAPPPASPSSPLPSSSHPPPSSPLLPPRHAAGAGIVYALGGGLVLFSLAAAPFFIVPWLPRARFGALPYLATSPSRASRLLAALPPGAVGAGRSFVDLGSGDGVLVLAAAAAGCRAVGVELNPTLHAVASARALLARLRGGGGGGGSATFLLGSMFDTSVREFDVVMAFGVVPLMPRIAAKLEAEASPVAVFVSRKFELPPGAAPSFTLARVVADDMFVYVREGSPGWPPAGEGGGGGGQGGGGGAGAGAREQTARGLSARSSMASFEAVNASYEADAATLRAAEAVYDRLVASHPLTVGKLLSASERDAKGLAASTLVYGEILFEPFAATLLKMKRQFGALHAPGGVFVDVGSGTGKPVFAACLLHAWAAARGVEVLDGLHRASLELLDAWQSPAVQSALPVGMGATDISFVRGDATLGGLAGGGLGLAAADAAAAAAARERAAGGGGGGGGAGGGGAGGGGGGAGGGGARDPADWSDADVVFMNSTCFSEPLMLALAAVAERMRAGSWAITLTRRLPSVRWRVVDQTVYSMSWGVATVFIHVKTG